MSLSKRTIKRAIEALHKQAQKLAIDANLYEEGVADTPTSKNAYLKRKAIFEAVAELETEQADGGCICMTHKRKGNHHRKGCPNYSEENG